MHQLVQERGSAVEALLVALFMLLSNQAICHYPPNRTEGIIHAHVDQPLPLLQPGRPIPAYFIVLHMQACHVEIPSRYGWNGTRKVTARRKEKEKTECHNTGTADLLLQGLLVVDVQQRVSLASHHGHWDGSVEFVMADIPITNSN